MWLGHHFRGRKVKGQLAGDGGILWRPPVQLVANTVDCCLVASRQTGPSLPRDAIRKRGLCCHPVSVRPSDTLGHCIQTAEDIVRLLSRSGSPVILVFWLRAPIPNSKGTPSAGAQNTPGWVGKFCDFRLNRRLSRKRYEIGPWLLWNVNRKSQVADRYVSVPGTWVTPNPGFKITV